MRIFRYKILLIIACLGLLIHACKKDEPTNPFDDPALLPPEEPLVVETLSPTSFAYLHKYIFKPTCANSGCHDGSFEPDYRTIYSTYNTLVYHPVISNDPDGSFTYRVLPGNADLSLIHERLTVFLPNSSGIMPLVTDPGSDWPTKSATYIQNIRTWINNGALDMYGNAPTEGNIQPGIVGLAAFNTGTTATQLSRIDGSDSPIGVSQGSTIDIWFSVSDDLTNATDMLVNQFKLNSSPYDFSTGYNGNIQIVTPITEDDFWGNPVSFTHKATIDLSTYPTGSFLYVRTYVQDADHTSPAEVPNDGSTTLLLTYFAIKII